MQKHAFVHHSFGLSITARILLGIALVAGVWLVAPISPVMAGLPVPEPYLVKDVNPGEESSEPHNLTAVENTLFFSAYDGLNGFELWRSDGMNSNTRMVKDIYPGGFDSFPIGLINVNGKLYFMANDGTHGEELWVSDGTDEGTLLVKDLFPGSGGGINVDGPNWVGVGDTLFFSADEPEHGAELWRSDGTESGTVLVKDINPGIGDSISEDFSFMAAVNGILYFYASDGIHGEELWRSDGTGEGTVMVKDIYPGASSSTGGRYPSLVVYQNKVFFQANDGIHGSELWQSDGTEAGTSLVIDIFTGIPSSYPLSLTAAENILYFKAADGVHGVELWKSDGTEVGTEMLKDIYPGGMDSVSGYDNYDFYSIGDTLFLQANDGTHGLELWRSDGTEAGTVLVKDIHAGYYGSIAGEFANLGGTLYFSAYDEPYGYELWQSDGTEAGTRLVKDVYPGRSDSYPRELTNVNGKLYFVAENSYRYHYLKTAGDITGFEPYGAELWSLNFPIYLPLIIN